MPENSKKRIKVMVVVGTRPEVIKVAPVIERLKRQPNDFETIIVATDQHHELLDQALSLFLIECLTTFASNQPTLLGLPVVAPYSPPVARILSLASSKSSVGKGPSPTRVV